MSNSVLTFTPEHPGLGVQTASSQPSPRYLDLLGRHLNIKSDFKDLETKLTSLVTDVGTHGFYSVQTAHTELGYQAEQRSVRTVSGGKGCIQLGQQEFQQHAGENCRSHKGVDQYV